MTRMIVLLFVSASILLFSMPEAKAVGVCMVSFQRAAHRCAKDRKCRKAAAKLLANFAVRVKLCKKYRKMIQGCRKAKFKARKSCVGVKKNCKKHCRRKVRSGKKRRMTCRAQCRRTKRRCAKAGRTKKRKCKNEAKNTEAFKICQDGRKMTRKAGGKFMLCASKHFLPAALVCAASMAIGG